MVNDTLQKSCIKLYLFNSFGRWRNQHEMLNDSFASLKRNILTSHVTQIILLQLVVISSFLFIHYFKITFMFVTLTYRFQFLYVIMEIQNSQIFTSIGVHLWEMGTFKRFLVLNEFSVDTTKYGQNILCHHNN